MGVFSIFEMPFTVIHTNFLTFYYYSRNFFIASATMSTRTVKPARIRTLHDSNDDDDEKKKSKRNGNPNDRGNNKSIN